MVSVFKLHLGTDGPKLEKPQDAKAVVDGNVITSQGPGTSLHGTLKKVEKRKLFCIYCIFLSEIIAEREREKTLRYSFTMFYPTISLPSSKKYHTKIRIP